MDKIMLLGSGELGRELVISLKRLGRHVVAVDSYDNAPAMQVADEREVINMLDGAELDRIVDKHRPVMIVPEIEAIRTERFYDYEQRGIRVIPGARAANFTMNRKAIRDLAAQDLGLRTAPYAYATDLASLQDAAGRIGFPCVVKPLMSSSGKGQSVLRSADDVATAWAYALEGSRGDVVEVIVEGFIDFHLEITLLTVTTVDGSVLFCPPIGHVQARGDYQESWQPAAMTEAQLKDAQEMAEKVTRSLGGPGLWGVEFFIAADGVYFSELSPRPHDTGMVTLSGSQDLSEFDLHARAITGLPIPGIALRRNGASAVILAEREGDAPVFSGLKDALAIPGSDIRLFGKPTTRPYRRMGVALYSSDTETVDEVREKAKAIAAFVTIN